MATINFKPDGTAEIQDEPGMNAEKNLKWLLDNLGEVERRGHKHAAGREEGVKIEQGRR